MSEPFYFQEIRIAGPGGYQEGVVALVCGPLAICQSRRGLWCITHVASGYGVASLSWWDEAAKAVLALRALDWDGTVEELGHRHRQAVAEAIARVRAETLATMIVPEGAPS